MARFLKFCENPQHDDKEVKILSFLDMMFIDEIDLLVERISNIFQLFNLAVSNSNQLMEKSQKKTFI